jgi:hypothetical protein
MEREKRLTESEELKKRLFTVYTQNSPPKIRSFLEKLKRLNRILDEEDENYRPLNSLGRTGGLIYLRTDLPTVVVPDLHARMDFFLHVCQFRYARGQTVLEGLASGQLQVLCLGDGLHGEGRAADRWRAAFDEFKGEYAEHRHMDEEMRESLGLMEMVIETKLGYPSLFHFLKGNHENIANEEGEGNYPFGKFAFEGEMVTAYVKKFYGEEFFLSYYSFEKKLPLLAVGRNFLVSHAEPRSFYPKDMVVDCYSHPKVIYDLTWTADNEAEQGSVQKMLDHYLNSAQRDGAYYFGGHRTINDTYNLRANGRYVQLHNPGKFIIALLQKERAIDPEKDIIELEQREIEL